MGRLAAYCVVREGFLVFSFDSALLLLEIWHAGVVRGAASACVLVVFLRQWRSTYREMVSCVTKPNQCDRGGPRGHVKCQSRLGDESNTAWMKDATTSV